jgi:hypothetical protein
MERWPNRFGGEGIILDGYNSWCRVVAAFSVLFDAAKAWPWLGLFPGLSSVTAMQQVSYPVCVTLVRSSAVTAP